MVPHFIPASSLTVPQVFFAQRMLEALTRRTIDSYRVRLHNPNTILQELYQVLTDYKNNKIKSFDITIQPLIAETIEMLKLGDHLLRPGVEPKLFLKLLQEGKAKKQEDKDKDRREDTLLMHALKIQIQANHDTYGLTLIQAIRVEIDRLSAQTAWQAIEFDRLNTLTDHWLSELLHGGYAKSYLYMLAWKLFKEDTNETFDSAFTFLTHVTTRDEERYRVVFNLLLFEKNFRPVRGRKQFLDAYLLSKDERTEMSTLSEDADGYLKDKSNYFIQIGCTGRDYLSVVHKARLQLNTLLDSIHLGFPEYDVLPLEMALVAGTNAPDKAQIQNAKYNIDGYFKNNQQMFDIWDRRLNAIRQDERIARETKNKITSAIRYLRLGWEAPGLEQKFLHYWIGMEYLFSNYDVGESTIRRLRKYFVYCELAGYVKRNIANFHGDIQRLGLTEVIPNYDDARTYLHDPATYAYIQTNLVEAQPLLAYRAARYHERLTNPKLLQQKGIERHRQNVDWHLARIYRVRNEIVHEAALHMNIETITGNLRYYLTFILSLLLDYLSQQPEDIDEDGKITIDDCLNYYEILFKGLETENFAFSKLMDVPDIIGTFY